MLVKPRQLTLTKCLSWPARPCLHPLYVLTHLLLTPRDQERHLLLWCSQALHFAKQWLLASFLAFLVVPSIPGTGLHLSSRTGCHSEGFLKPGTVTTDVIEQKFFSSNLDIRTILAFWKSTNSSTESFCMSSSQLPLTLILCINMVHLSKAGSGHSYATIS